MNTSSPQTLSKLSDTELVEQMKVCNYEKYKTLVRMHLSFELELNTDEFDLPAHEIVYEDKGKLKKWNRLSKKHKIAAGTVCANTAKSAGNSPTEGLSQQIDAGFIFHLAEIKEFLMLEKNLQQEGIFRKAGSSSRQNELRLRFQNEQPLNLNIAGYTAHDCATVFKSYLAELTEPLLTDAHYPAHLQIAPLCIGMSFNHQSTSSSAMLRPERIKREQRLLNSMQYLLLLLPDDNRSLLIHIIDILNAVIKFESNNKMSADNLATLFAPHLICPRNLPPEALHYLSKKLSSIIAYMIMKGAEIFEIPAKLLTDIRAYFLCKRKKTISPEKTLDDSISDISTVNTVYTFVDRERTAAAHTANTTDTELAQLYAHIQSLPESSKKRRLIKQFNKQNGQGTPLQLVILNRLKNSEASRSAKSISDSIKKHIFHKGIMSRTPKRSNAHLKTPTPVGGVETPNFSNTKQPKLRVLFQSPVSTNIHSINNVTNNTTLKTHPLQKSISSTSLLMNSSSTLNSQIYQHVKNSKQKNDEIENSTTSSSTSSSTSTINSNNDEAKQPFPFQQNKQQNLTIKLENNKSSSNVSLTTSTTPAAAFEIKNKQIATATQTTQTIAAECCIKSTDNNKKAVNWVEVEQSGENSGKISQAAKEFKSRYKSEPNLSSILDNNNSKQLLEIPKKINENVTNARGRGTGSGIGTGIGKTITLNKLIKGVSMGNLKFPLVRSVSSISKRHRRHSDEAQTSTTSSHTLLHQHNVNYHHHYELEDLDDHTFEDSSRDHIDTEDDTDTDNDDDHDISVDIESENENKVEKTLGNEITTTTNESNSCDLIDHHHDGFNASETYDQILVQPTGLYRNIDLITSTPALLLGRRSMSPITKSAQRMPKSMQESIMTPRSRKPVMVFTTNLGSSDQNRTIYQSNELSSFREQDDDDDHSEGHEGDEKGNGTPPIQMISAVGGCTNLRRKQQEESKRKSKSNEALTDNFKKYLRSRSVFTDGPPPVDSSFSSHSDDFKDDDDADADDDEVQNSTERIVNLNDSQLSPSLLYCLDGNVPLTSVNVLSAAVASSETINEKAEQFHHHQHQNDESNSSTSNDQYATPPTHMNKYNHRFRFDNALKRGAASTQNESNKENDEQHAANEYLVTKKIFISDFPNETSF